ncbi:unnamed protein product [Rhizoctonia solani]|nr:unnamed protein product [Rhizoctonia solani]
MSPLSLAEQIAQLEDTAPPDVDIERFDGGGLGEDEETSDLTAGRGHYLDVGASSLRKQRDTLVDPKYEGVRTTRSQLYEFDDETEDDIQGDSTGSKSQDEESGIEDEENLSEPKSVSEDEGDKSEERVNKDESGGSEAGDASQESPTNNLTEALKQTREADKDKGRAIVQQRTLWDSLLETRIRLQKSATAANRLPHPNNLAAYVTSEKGQEAVQSLLKEVLSFSDELLTLRKRLAQVNEPEIEIPSAKKRKIDSEDETLEQQTREKTAAAIEMDEAYHPTCVQTLQKWSNKIAAVTPASLSARSGKSFRGSGVRSTVELVEDALGESGAKAIGRTRVRRSVGPRIGTQVSSEAEGAEGDAEVFDDLDFYQALLRDVIDSRTGAGDDWMARQRTKKAKKVVDTKASKGRKLRYEVHEKLQNFMVPVPTATWHEEQIDELFANLLGVVCGGPIQNEGRLLARQVTASTEATVVQTTSQAITTARTTTRSSATSATPSPVATSSTVSTTVSVTTTTQSSTATQPTSTQTTSHISTVTSNTSSSSSTTASSSSTTTSSSTTSASATSTASSNIFSKSSPYFGYAIGVLVVVCIFGSLLLVLVIRWLIQKFSKKPNPPAITSNAGAWRYSQDTELYSPGAAPDSANNTTSTARHKGLRPEMGEAQAFLSTESVALYPPVKYTDEESDPRRHTRSLSNASSSQATTTPYVQRRPISLLHSPSATHPAFIVDRDQESNSGHGHSDAVEMKAVPEEPKEGQPSGTYPGSSMAGMLLARAGHSDAYRQSTVGSTTMISRAASTASAYSQPSGIYTPPPMPELPPPPMPVAPQAQAQPRPQPRDLSPDMVAVLSSMQNNTSTDTIPVDGLIHQEDNHATLRPTPGRMGWGRQAPSSIHSHSDLFFGHEER